jgi:lysophospholipase L1-like esterase
MRWLTAATGATLALTGIAVNSGPAQAESFGGVRIMPLGDSITDGIDIPGGYRTELWRRLRAAGYRNDFVGSQFNGPRQLSDHDHEGHPGWRIDEIDASVEGWLRAAKPHSVLLHIGSNDVAQSIDLPGAPARLSKLVDHITTVAPNAEVFVATIVPFGWPSGDAAVQAYNNTIPAMVKSKARNGKHVHLVDMHSALTPDDLGADDLHPTAAGYAKMAKVWSTALQAVPKAAGSRTRPPWIRRDPLPR